MGTMWLFWVIVFLGFDILCCSSVWSLKQYEFWTAVWSSCSWTRRLSHHLVRAVEMRSSFCCYCASVCPRHLSYRYDFFRLYSIDLAGHTCNRQLFCRIISKHSYVKMVMNRVVPSRIPCMVRVCVTSGRISELQVPAAEGAPRGVAWEWVCAGPDSGVSVLLKWVSCLFSLHFDACDWEVLQYVNSVPFGQNVYSRRVPHAFQLANGLQFKKSPERTFSLQTYIG